MGPVNKLQIATRRLSDGTTANCVIQLRTKAGKYKSFCSSEFDLPDGLWKDLIENDSVQRARLCKLCLERMNILRLNIPDTIPTGWRENPYDHA